MMVLLCGLLILVNGVLIALLVSLAKAYPRQVQWWLTTLRWRRQRWWTRVAGRHDEARIHQRGITAHAEGERAALAADVAELCRGKREVRV